MADPQLQAKLDAAEAAVKSGNHKVHDVMYDTAIVQGIVSAEIAAAKLDANTDQLETLVGATNTALGTTNTRLNTVNTTLTAIDTKGDTTNTKLDAIIALLTQIEVNTR